MQKTLQAIVIAGAVASFILAIDRFTKDKSVKRGFQAGFAGLNTLAAIKRITSPDLEELAES